MTLSHKKSLLPYLSIPILLLAMVFLIPSSTNAQEEKIDFKKMTKQERKALRHPEMQSQIFEDVVYLKNGSIIRGQVIEQKMGEYIKIKIVGGSIFVYKTEEVDKIEKEEKETVFNKYVPRRMRPKIYKEKGVIAHLKLGFMPGVNTGGWAVLGVNAHGLLGYHLNPNWMVGIGMGIDGYFPEALTPIYLEGRYYLKQSSLSPYARLAAGYASAIPNWQTVSANGGIYLNPGVGVRFGSRSKVHFTFDFGLKLQKAYYVTRTWNWDWNGNGEELENELDILFRRTDFSFGLMF